MKFTCIQQLCAAAAILMFGTLGAYTQSPGDLDTTFGNAGVTTTYVATTQNNLSPGKGAMQSDGKILQLADAHLNTGNSFTNVVIRYNTDGTLDSTFGNGGFLYMNWNGANNAFGNAYAITTQTIGANEKIIVAGSGSGGSGSLRVDRYNSDGGVDASFGTNGRALLNVGYALAVAVQPDGKIITMGDVGALVRLNVNGTLDAAFGIGGVVQSSAVKAQALAVQSNGRIIAAGFSSVKGSNAMTVARFNTNGSLDDGGRNDSTPGDSFGSSGKTIVDFFGGNSSFNDVKIDGNGKIVAAGGAGRKNSNNTDFGVARLTTNGQPDTTFGSIGKASVDFSGLADNAWSLDLQSNGKIFLTGIMSASTGSGGNNAALTRFNSNGTPDLSFGQNGKVVSDYSNTNENFRDGFIQIDPICGCEKMIIVGTAETGGIDFAIAARYIL